MAGEVREVVARLKIDQEGDPKVFSAVADDLEAIPQSASGAREAFAAVLDVLRDAGASADELEKIETGINKVAAAADRFAEAKGIDEQKEAVSALEAAWREFGSTFQSEIDKNEFLAKSFAEALAEIQAKGASLADPITAGLDEVTERLNKLDESGKNGFRGFEQGAALAASELAQLRAEIARAEAEGRDVGDGARASLKQLEDQFEQTKRKAADFRNTQQDVKDEMKGLRSETDIGRGSINDLGDVFEKVSPKVSKFIGIAAGIAGALFAGYEAGEQLREGLNKLTEGGFDRGLQGVISRVLNLDEGLDSAGQSTQRLTNLQNILRNQGIDPTGKSLAELEKLVTDLAKKKVELGQATDDLAKKEGVLASEVAKTAKALVESITQFAKSNEQLDDIQIGKIFKDQIQEVLDSLEKLGKEDPGFAAFARRFGVMSSSVEADSKKTTAAVEAMYNAIVGETKTFAGTFEQQAAVIRAVFAQLTPKDLEFGSKGWEEARRILQQYVDESRKAGVQIPKDIADQAAALGVLVSAYEVAKPGLTSFSGAQDDIAGKVVKTTQTFDAQGNELGRLSSVAARAGSLVKEAGSDVKEGGERAGEAAKPVNEAQRNFDSALASFTALGKGAKSAGGQVKEGAEDAAAGTEKIGQAGAAGREAGAGLEAAGAGASKFGQGGKEAAAGADQVGASLESLLQSVPSISEAFERMGAVKLGGLRSEIASLNADLDALITKAGAAKAAVDAIDGAPAGAPT